MESAQALDGDDATAGQQLNAALDDSVAGLACGADGRCRGRIPARIAVYSLAPRNMRPAIKAGIGLRVKTPVEWVGILRGALGTHGETVHRCGRSVIRQRSDDGKAWAAVSAVDKGVVIASVGGIEQFAQAIVTGGDIGRDERRVRGLVLRCYDAKALFIGGIPTVGCQVHNLDILYAGCCRCMLRKRGNKSIERIGRSVRLDMHAVARIEHPSTNAMCHGLAIHKRSHANALHNARHMNMHMPHATPLIKTDQKKDRFILVGKTSKPAKTNLSLFGRCAAGNPAIAPGSAWWRRR